MSRPADAAPQAPYTTKSICLSAVHAAVVFIMTFIPRIPIPLGYAHLGDAVIFLSFLYFNRREAALAAAIGSCLSDFLGGFPLWIAPTFVIKYVMVLIVFAICCRGTRKSALYSVRTLIAFLLSSLWMAIAYTLAGAVLFGSIQAGLASLPGLLMEGLLNTIAAMGAGIFLKQLPTTRQGSIR